MVDRRTEHRENPVIFLLTTAKRFQKDKTNEKKQEEERKETKGKEIDERKGVKRQSPFQSPQMAQVVL